LDRPQAWPIDNIGNQGSSVTIEYPTKVGIAPLLANPSAFGPFHGRPLASQCESSHRETDEGCVEPQRGIRVTIKMIELGQKLCLVKVEESICCMFRENGEQKLGD
jgi:hypothetical protein